MNAPRPSFVQDGKNYLLVIAILLERLGGSQTIVQDDIDRVAFNYIDETFDPNGEVRYTLRQREKTS